MRPLFPYKIILLFQAYFVCIGRIPKKSFLPKDKWCSAKTPIRPVVLGEKCMVVTQPRRIWYVSVPCGLRAVLKAEAPGLMY